MGEFKGIWVDKKIIDLKLSPSKTMVLSMIKEMQPFHASNRYISEKLNLTPRAVSSIITELTKQNLISISGNTSARTITIEETSLDSYRRNFHSTIEETSYTLEETSSTIEETSTNIKDSKDKKVNSKKKPKKHKYGEYKNVLLSDEEYEKLQTKTGNRSHWITTMDEGIEMKGYSYKSHYLAILKWFKKDGGKVEVFNTNNYDPTKEIFDGEDYSRPNADR